MHELFMANRHAMMKPLERRGLTLDQVDVFLECSSTPLPVSSDCYLLAENILHVRRKSWFMFNWKSFIIFIQYDAMSS